MRRLADDGGDPVVGLQTNFGGGKTHSMLALYHLSQAHDTCAEQVGNMPSNQWHPLHLTDLPVSTH